MSLIRSLLSNLLPFLFLSSFFFSLYLLYFRKPFVLFFDFTYSGFMYIFHSLTFSLFFDFIRFLRNITSFLQLMYSNFIFCFLVDLFILLDLISSFVFSCSVQFLIFPPFLFVSSWENTSQLFSFISSFLCEFFLSFF